MNPQHSAGITEHVRGPWPRPWNDFTSRPGRRFTESHGLRQHSDAAMMTDELYLAARAFDWAKLRVWRSAAWAQRTWKYAYPTGKGMIVLLLTAVAATVAWATNALL